MPKRTWPSVYQPSRCSGAPFVVVPEALERRQLDRLVARRRRAPAQSPTTTCSGAASDGGRERDRDRDARVAPAVPAQPAPRVDGRDAEADDDVAGEVHVHELVPERAVVEERATTGARRRPCRRRCGSRPGWFIQPLTAITISEPAMPAITIGMPASRCRRGDMRSQP